jgi:hypothetical protein
MVNRFLFLTGFIIFAILTNSIGNGHLSLSAVQESTISDHHFDYVQNGDNFDSGKSKTVFHETYILLIFLVLSLAVASNRNSALYRRLIMLTPVFYQSNYVDKPHLNNQLTI